LYDDYDGIEFHHAADAGGVQAESLPESVPWRAPNGGLRQ
jgi:hypothetical protein